MRQEGGLKPNSFVSMEGMGSPETDLLLKLSDHGDAEAYLSSASMKKSANRLIQRGVIAANAEYGGWLGKYHRILVRQEEPSKGAGRNESSEIRRRTEGDSSTP